MNVWLYATPAVAAGKGETVVIVSAAGFTVRLNAWVVVEPPVHCTVKLAVVAVVGVPLSTPPLLSVNPAGKLPALMNHEYGVVPPLAAKVWLYATPAVAAGRGEVVVIVSGGGGGGGNPACVSV